MAKQFTVEIDGNAVANVLDVSFGLECERDTNGAPVDARPRLGVIKITRRSDETLDYWTWALKPHAEYFKSGKIEFLDPKKEKQVLRTVVWKDGFVKSYREDVPHINKHKNRPQSETFEISASTITINDVEWTGQGTWA